MENSDYGTWEITFTDMITLLLTFFVFIISVSSFEIFGYKKLWEETGKSKPEVERKPATTSFRFELIKGLSFPRWSDEAEQLLEDIEQVFVTGDVEGVNVNFDENKITLMVSEKLSFEEGKYDLREEAGPLLLKLTEPINRSKFDLSIEGHTDASTSPQVNKLELSLNRALAVARFLIVNGVDKQKISVAGYGPYRPIADNDTPGGRQLNRRVEVNIIIRNE